MKNFEEYIRKFLFKLDIITLGSHTDNYDN